MAKMVSKLLLIKFEGKKKLINLLELDYVQKEKEKTKCIKFRQIECLND